MVRHAHHFYPELVEGNKKRSYSDHFNYTEFLRKNLDLQISANRDPRGKYADYNSSAEHEGGKHNEIIQKVLEYVEFRHKKRETGRNEPDEREKNHERDQGGRRPVENSRYNEWSPDKPP